MMGIALLVACFIWRINFSLSLSLSLLDPHVYRTPKRHLGPGSVQLLFLVLRSRSRKLPLSPVISSL